MCPNRNRDHNRKHITVTVIGFLLFVDLVEPRGPSWWTSDGGQEKEAVFLFIFLASCLPFFVLSSHLRFSAFFSFSLLILLPHSFLFVPTPYFTWLGAQRTKIWLIHGLWTKPLVHGLPWTCQAVISQWLQQRNFQTMNLEDPASRSTSSSSSNSASSSESLFAFFDPSSTLLIFFFNLCPFWTSMVWLRPCDQQVLKHNRLLSSCETHVFEAQQGLAIADLRHHSLSYVFALGSFLSWCGTLLYGTECTERR